MLRSRKIPLSQGKYAIVDTTDYEWLSIFNWHYSDNGYAVRRIGDIKKKTTIRMHRLIAKTPKDMYTDHINGDRLDNRRCNLRICSKSQNSMNSGIRKQKIPKKSKYRGVGWHKQADKWRAYIQFEGKQYSLGLYDSEGAAARAYNKIAKKYFREFAKLNIIEIG